MSPAAAESTEQPLVSTLTKSKFVCMFMFTLIVVSAKAALNSLQPSSGLHPAHFI
jgi:hypothetical protein